ncbi:ATP-grasp domain-containing protein [Gloeothece verrucosa]|uniref:Succinate--CoA ligase (ADP-forming) n=1 Tax=Gloeothece verrucosa (strain PCC 7822) TaxID=497965 RepID=E0UI65_GLOV7|nr:ATP-grasp domain-containing protein [Gloeothece verrucosa]ADN15717.1 Succinate--CoA ligase (ADP-forming) [Gloeothece verrucosa PCC 7822]
MDLLEYHAKELFDEVGIPVLPSQPIHDTGELKRLQIPYPVVLKSQVRAGGRGKSGGIRFVENTIDAIAAARAIFSLPILGEYPEVILAEARYDAQEEFFLAVVLDYQLQRPVLLGSVKGGMDVEALLEYMQRVVIEEEFSPFYARRLVKKMGIAEGLIESVSTIIEKMYYLFWEKDLDLIEINPLGVNAQGEVMALDGKISVNDCALDRHPELACLICSKKDYLQGAAEENALRDCETVVDLHWLEGVDELGNVGIICNSHGLALTTWDLIVQAQGKPNYCLILEEGSDCPSLSQQLELGLEQMMELSALKAVLVNIVASPEVSETVAQAIANYLQPQLKQQLPQKGEERIIRATGAGSSRKRLVKTRSQSSKPQQIQWVIRLINGEVQPIQESLSLLPLHWTKTLDDAVNQTISILKSK